MAELDSTDPMMDEATLFAFLGELDNDWVLDSTPQMTPALLSRKPKRNRLSGVKKPRKSRRLELLKTRDEIADLHRQLQTLHDIYGFRALLETQESDWKLLAMHECILKQKADKENARLRKLLDIHVTLIQQLTAHMQHHIEMVAKAVNGENKIASINDAAHIYEVMQICLDMRCKSQLDPIVSQCNDASACKVQRIHWKTLPLGDRDVGVEFRESVAMPFKSVFILRAIRPSSVLNVYDCARSNTTGQSALTHLSPSRAVSYFEAPSKQQLFLQRLVNLHGKPILLWEDALCWQTDAKSAPVIVRCSGWALVTSVPDHSDALSVVHAGGFIQIHATDGALLKPSDLVVKEIVRSMQTMQRSRRANLENALMNAHCRSRMQDAKPL